VSPARFLLDTSALVRLLRDGAVRGRWEEQIIAGLVAVCPLVEWELLYTARSMKHRAELRELIATAFVWVPMPDRVFTRAAEVQDILTRQGQHRSAGAVDLLVAAAAELNSLTLLHYDRDFDQVTRATGQAAVWLAPAGSID
jgi:Predicted nucleic acid-binding protein, contains PIN domain